MDACGIARQVTDSRVENENYIKFAAWTSMIESILLLRLSSFTKMNYLIVCVVCMVVLISKDNTIATFREIIGIFHNRATRITNVPSKRPTGIFRRDIWSYRSPLQQKNTCIVPVDMEPNNFGFVIQLTYLGEVGGKTNPT